MKHEKDASKYAVMFDGEVIGYIQEYEITPDEASWLWFEALWYSVMWRN